MTAAPRVIYGWAIDPQSTEGHGLIGKYWRFDASDARVPWWMDGYVTAVFTTRWEALNALPSVRKAFKRAKVVRVSVSVAVIVASPRRKSGHAPG